MFVSIPSEVYEFEPIDYLTNGKNCVYTAQMLKDGPDKIKTNYSMRVLLVHGIELLLKAFIQHFDKSKLTHGHDLKELYNIVEEIGKSQNLNILASELNDAINKISSDYYSDSVKARYNNTNSWLDFSVFTVLRELFIEPLEKVVNLQKNS